MVKIVSNTKNKNISDSDLIKIAIRGVLFKGFTDSNNRISQKPLAGGPANEIQYHDFYSEFFSDSGSAAKFGTVIDGSRTVAKVKNKYRVTAIVSVNKELLIIYLQSAGIIQSLNSIF